MNKKSKQYPNPRFSSIEEEDKYWETHSPLDEGFEGKVETSKQQRSSFLSVRMTGDELFQLRDMAAKQGLGPSTYARLLLTNAISRQNGPALYLSNCLHFSDGEFRDTPERSGICIMNTDDITINQDVINSMWGVIRSASKCRIVTPDDADYEKVERLVKVQPQPSISKD